MRLSFPNGDYPDVLVADGSVRLGASSDNDIALPELSERHARLTRDARGVVLEILDASARAHVNARPVREKAFVRYGDTLCLGAVTIAVIQHLPEEAVGEPGAWQSLRQGLPRGVLRGMNGKWFGKSVAIGEQLVVGSDDAGELCLSAHPQVREFARIDVAPGAIHLSSSEVAGTLVNGLRRERVSLKTGDQLSFGRDRFVVECSSAETWVPDLIAAEAEPEHATEPAAVDQDDDAAGTSTAIWWLIAAAALIGAALAAVLAAGV